MLLTRPPTGCRGFFWRGAWIRSGTAQAQFGSTARLLSLYFQIPFCWTLYYDHYDHGHYRGNSTIPKRQDLANEFLHYLEREMDLNTSRVGFIDAVKELDLGGGTSTLQRDLKGQEPMAGFRRNFYLLASSYCPAELPPFALPGDELAVTKRQGRFYRNIQGNRRQNESDLMSLDVSAIGKVGAVYSQKSRTMNQYYDQLNQGPHPAVPGMALLRDDLIRRSVTMSLMCYGEVLFESMNLAYLIDFRHYFAAEFNSLLTLADRGLVTVNDEGIRVTKQGQLLLHVVVTVFDRYLQAEKARASFSEAI